MNETGSYIWSQLRSKPRPLKSLVQDVLGEFDIDEATCIEDVHNLAHHLEQKGLVEWMDP